MAERGASSREVLMNDDYSKRGYLLPEGFKDLIDVFNLASKTQPEPAALPQVTQTVLVADPISVPELAVLVKRKPFQIIVDLMAFEIYADLNQELDFETASGLLKKYGILAKRMP